MMINFLFAAFRAILPEASTLLPCVGVLAIAAAYQLLLYLCLPGGKRNE